MTHASLFSGVGGFDLAAEWMGWTNMFQVEIDPFCNKVLAKNFPHVKRYGDIKQFNGTEYRGTIDVLTGGFPCQPFSVAGKRAGTEDNRYLWPEMLRVIREIKPAWIVAENVRGLLTIQDGMVFEQACTDLENEGYEVQPFIIPACSVGAPHRRDRIWFIAHSKNDNRRKCEDRSGGLRESSEIQMESVSRLCEGKYKAQREDYDASPHSRKIEGYGSGSYQWGQAGQQEGKSATRSSLGELPKQKASEARRSVFPEREEQMESRNMDREKEAVHRDFYNQRGGDSGIRGEKERSSTPIQEACGERSGIIAHCDDYGSHGSKDRQSDSQGNDCDETRKESVEQFAGCDVSDAGNTNVERLEGYGEDGECTNQRTSRQTDWQRNWSDVATELCGVAHGIPDRIHRIKSLGNSIVPQIAFEIFNSILLPKTS